MTPRLSVYLFLLAGWAMVMFGLFVEGALESFFTGSQAYVGWTAAATILIVIGLIREEWTHRRSARVPKERRPGLSRTVT